MARLGFLRPGSPDRHLTLGQHGRVALGGPGCFLPLCPAAVATPLCTCRALSLWGAPCFSVAITACGWEH